MEVVYERCCGLDVHKETVVACALGGSGKETRTFGTMTRDCAGFTSVWVRQPSL